ncbi:methyltransferase N6AMT1 isoform X3 [Macaca fascicularis]|uniref:methyltransferase N6AMT1 isoform X3 n=1 Tax=Macaca fascicularis TaxID=9541 RepID=UPI003D157C7A
MAENFRLICDTKGHFAVHHITPEEAKYKLCKVRRIFVGTKGIPYLVTHDACTICYPDPLIKVGSHGIEAAWAGGRNGREVMDRFFPLVPDLLSPRGLFYLVTIKENNPEEILKIMKTKGLQGTTALSRQAGQETLSVLKFTKS